MDVPTEIYLIAQKKAGRNGRALRDMGKFAYAVAETYGKHSEELEAVIAAYQRSNVASYVKAVKLMGDWFTGKAKHADAYLALYAVCGLPDKARGEQAKMLSELAAHPGEIELGLVLEAVKELKTRKPREKKEKRCPHCGGEL